MDFQFPANSSPAPGANQSANALLAPRQQSQHMRSAPPLHHRPVPGQPRGHAGVVQDVVVRPANAASNHWLHEDGEDMFPPVENIAAQGQLQDLRYGSMGHYDMANNHFPLHEHHEHIIRVNNDAGLAFDAPVRAQAAPLAPIDVFDDPSQDRAAGSAWAFPGEWPHPGPATEALRQLAILYLREPNSRVALIRMEPCHAADGVRVVVTVELPVAGF